MSAGSRASPPRLRLRTKTKTKTSASRLRAKIQLPAAQAPAQAPPLPGRPVAVHAAESVVPPQTDLRLGGFELAERNDDYVIVKKGIDSDMLARLLQFLKRKRPRAAKMKNEGGDSDDERKARYDDRDSAVSWFSAEQECAWFQDRLAQITQDVGNVQWPILNTQANGQLICEYEKCQYAVYGKGQHFQAWHQDAFEEGHDPEDARQITIVLMLSDRKAYRGGDLKAKVVNSAGRKVIRKLRMGAGDCVVFPAKKLVHCVSRVESGIRKSIVFWANDRASCISGREQLAKEDAA